MSGRPAGASWASLVPCCTSSPPIDLVPELLLPFLGLGDDALVIGWIAASLINETESFLTWEREREGTVRREVIS